MAAQQYAIDYGERLRQDATEAGRVGAAAAFVGIAAIVAANITGIPYLLLGGVFCGVIVGLCVIDIIADYVELRNLER